MTLLAIIKEVKNHNGNISLDEARSLTNAIDCKYTYSEKADFIERLIDYTGTEWGRCDHSEFYFPEYQAEPTVGALEGALLFSEYRKRYDHRYQWAECTHGEEGYTTNDDARYIEDRDIYVTERLYLREGYFYCAGCESYFSDDGYGGDGYCSSCYEEDEPDDHDSDSSPIYSYNTRIDDVRHFYLRQDTRYFGIELEQEFPNDRPSERARWANDNIDGLTSITIWKSDGSLTNGAELVSIPQTLAQWQDETNNPIRDLCNNPEWRRAARSHDTRTCGLHVHVSRSTVPEPVIAKLVVLMNDPSMGETTALVARRAPNTTYCMAEKKRWHSDYNRDWHDAKYRHDIHLDKKPSPTAYVRPHNYVCKKQNPQGGRYTPVNVTEHTLEFRIFRGTLKWETVLASIEYCDAVISFCTQHGASAMYAEEFVKWLKQAITRNTYPALQKYLQQRTLLPKPRPKPEPVSEDTSTECRSVPEEVPAATFVMDPYDGQRPPLGNTAFFEAPGDHYIAHRNTPVRVCRSHAPAVEVQPGEIWWNSARTCSLRVQPTNVQI